MKKWSEQHLKKLLADGKIRGYTVMKVVKTHNNTCNYIDPRSAGDLKKPNFEKRSREKNWLAWNLELWSREHLLNLVTEYEFDEERKWRFDYCFPDLKVGVEYEGIFGGVGGHSSITGLMRDIDKYNAAQAQGWRIIRITAADYKTVLNKLNYYLIKRACSE